MISGGWGEGNDDLTSAEIYPAGTSGGECRIPSMPTRRSFTVTKEFLVCGGWGHRTTWNTCIIFNPESGRWEDAHKLNQNRIW